MTSQRRQGLGAQMGKEVLKMRLAFLAQMSG